MPIAQAQTDAEIQECWPVMSQLRANLIEAEFITVIRRQFAEGYRLVFIRGEHGISALAGYRILNNLIWGRFCYVDDLVTDSQARSQGQGTEMLNWLCDTARVDGCTRLELDSGVQRFDAHRFYLRQRMYISCHHFSLVLNENKN